MISPDEAERLVGVRLKERILIAIDGRPVSGKSTLAMRLADRFNLPMLCIDDFMAPERDWMSRAPGFPYPFFRNAVFVDAVHTLKREGRCTYTEFDWEAVEIGTKERILIWDGPLIVEGCSVLQEPLPGLYDLRFFIESDEASTYAAAMARDGERWALEWRTIFLPSVVLYMETNPRARADHVVAGRGVSSRFNDVARD